ncbi:3'-5' exonuclease KapD [Lihuaxuella thermophila]|uniref:Sporulation inhibitor KapD n=1 Tax=Lihuaxuella thermophila TaxID=1173111 RepID=A0A1H8BD23_9BACL|nr:3'-5' exonuclease KapD [Lihuaxuella thermophila]SEM80723.1 sporulation inhibitor KapD [Lihuaxuella thermophila]
MADHHLFIDFEFTMPETERRDKSFVPEIIEVGMVCVSGLEVQQTFSSYVKPVINPILTERCKAFLNITQADVDQGISFTELVEILKTFDQSGNARVVTWGNMDMYVLRKSCEYWGVPYPFKGREADLSIEYKNFYGDRNQTGLIKALHEYGYKAKGKHHRALDDALATFEIYKLIENDRRYLNKTNSPCIGDFVDVASLFGKVGSGH